MTTTTTAQWLAIMQREYVRPSQVAPLLGMTVEALRSGGMGMGRPQHKLGSWFHYQLEEVLAFALRRAVYRKWLRLKDPAWLRSVYGGHLDKAMVDAAEAMFVLNRHAKCDYVHQRDQIYRLKNRFVGWLFARGKCVGWNQHKTERLCYCTEDHDGGCYRCDHGIYSRQFYVVFRFDVEGRRYTWHQPEHLVNWAYRDAPKYEDENDWDPYSRKFGEFEGPCRYVEERMALVRWVMEVAS